MIPQRVLRNERARSSTLVLGKITVAHPSGGQTVSNRSSSVGLWRVSQQTASGYSMSVAWGSSAEQSREVRTFDIHHWGRLVCNQSA